MRLGGQVWVGFVFVPLAVSPHKGESGFMGVFAMNPSLNPLGCSKQMETYSMCEPNQKKLIIINLCCLNWFRISKINFG